MILTPAVFLTWCRFPGLSPRPSPLWTSLPSSSRWEGWRRRCSRKTPGKSGSKHFLQRQEMTRCHAWLSCRLVKVMRFMCTAPKILYHITSAPSKSATAAETLHVILLVTCAVTTLWNLCIIHTHTLVHTLACAHIRTDTFSHTQFTLKVVAWGCM